MSESSNEIDEVLDEMKQSGTLDPLKQKAFSLLKDDVSVEQEECSSFWLFLFDTSV